MTRQPVVAKLIKQAEHLLRSGQFGDSRVRHRGQVEDPIPVLKRGGTLHAWFIPVTVKGRIAGFFLLSLDATLLRYSTFQRHEGDLDSCPLSAAWTDKSTILQVADKVLLADEVVKDFYLSFDGVPSRIAWAIDTELPNGQTRTLYVAGDSAWSAP